ncbi:MAG TPA: cytochrome b N-terminal domain-containing protein [Jatrophihabitans sp.]|jgi:ubiquinol-cytochrome c reductase cytochrome b subunit|nr:cytochrome b N-terminal domain-containing protein [Jatrophihabitans sp.]
MSSTDERMWTARVRSRAVRALPPDKLLPDRQPVYVSSWIYVFGVLTLAAFVVVLVSGVVLGVEGPQWWHRSSVGLFFNSLHLWSVQLFLAFMVVHLWGKFFMAAWRGRRAMTWITGALAFIGSVGTAFTGYLIQENFDSQWISTQAKDGLNSVGIGSFFNVLNYGQMLIFHVVLLPFVMSILIVWHIVLVRLRGVVPPFPPRSERSAFPSAEVSSDVAAPADAAAPAEEVAP